MIIVNRNTPFKVVVIYDRGGHRSVPRRNVASSDFISCFYLSGPFQPKRFKSTRLCSSNSTPSASRSSCWRDLVTAFQADFTLCVDHTLPGNISRTGSHRTSHPAWSKSPEILRGHSQRQWQICCNLSIGGNFPNGYQTYDLPNMDAKSLRVGR